MLQALYSEEDSRPALSGGHRPPLQKSRTAQRCARLDLHQELTRIGISTYRNGV